MDVIIGIIAGVIIFYFIFKSQKSPSSPPIQSQSKPTKQKKPSRPKPSIEKDFYKKKGIKNFRIVGVKHYNLRPEEYGGGGRGFTGSIKTVENSHDKYAVGVFDSNGNQIGHTPKNNNRLHHSLNEWHNGKSLAWGHLRYDDYIKNWEGTVYSPIGYSSEEMEKIERIATLREEIRLETKNKENTTEGYFQILEKHRIIIQDLEDLKHPTDLDYAFPANFIPTVSKHLEKEKEWDSLLDLEKYDDLINQLNDRFKGATLKRIEKAKTHVHV